MNWPDVIDNAVKITVPALITAGSTIFITLKALRSSQRNEVEKERRARRTARIESVFADVTALQNALEALILRRTVVFELILAMKKVENKQEEELRQASDRYLECTQSHQKTQANFDMLHLDP